MREWKSQVVHILSVAAKVSGNPELVTRVSEEADELLAMVLHQDGSYILTAKPDKPAKPELSDLEMLELLDKKLGDG